MKVNQNRAVIESIFAKVRDTTLPRGGSKAELYAALGLEQSKDSLWFSTALRTVIS